MVAGRPRTTSYSPEKMIELGKEMVEYVCNDKNNVLTISQWYSLKKLLTWNQFNTMRECQEFFPYYEKCQNYISIKYLDGTIKAPIAQRFLPLYFKDLKDEEYAKLAYEQSLKTQSDMQLIEKYEPAMLQMLSQIKIRQENLRVENATVTIRKRPKIKKTLAVEQIIANKPIT